METIQGLEYTLSDEGPSLDGDYIRNVLVLGRESKNAWNASVTGAGDTAGPRRKFNKILSASEEVAKFSGRPAYILHKAPPRKDDDLLGTFDNPHPSDKGLRCDLLCRKVDGTESYHPQVIALRDNIAHKRPFGGFSPRFDFTVDPTTGELQTIIACESIDLVPQPASVKSAVEEEGGDTEHVTREEHEALRTDHESLRTEHAALESRVKACECYMAGHRAAGSEQRSDVIPAAPKKVTTTAKNFREFVRS